MRRRQWNVTWAVPARESRSRRIVALAGLLSAFAIPHLTRAQGTCSPVAEPRPTTGAVSPRELAALPGPWRVEVIATRGRWGLNQKPDSLGRAAFYLLLRRVDTAGAVTRTIGIRPDSLRPLGGRLFRSSPSPYSLGSAVIDSSGTGMWMFGRTLYAGHPGGTDAVYDAFELTSVDSVQFRGRFFRSWGIGVPLEVSGDSATPPAGYFCASRPARLPKPD